jgi:phosphomannomutase
MLLNRLRNLTASEQKALFGLGDITNIDETDGVRLTFEGGEIVHLRPSGNAPELRCYAESSTEDGAERLVSNGLDVARSIA